jgi:hypothetical protein
VRAAVAGATGEDELGRVALAVEFASGVDAVEQRL